MKEGLRVACPKCGCYETKYRYVLAAEKLLERYDALLEEAAAFARALFLKTDFRSALIDPTIPDWRSCEECNGAADDHKTPDCPVSLYANLSDQIKERLKDE